MTTSADGSTSSEASAPSTASIAAPAVWNTSGTANHSACQLPSPRSSSCGLAWVITVETPRHASPAAIARIASIGLRLPAAADEAPARVVISPSWTSWAMSPPTLIGPTRGVAGDVDERDDRGTVGVPRRRNVKCELLGDGTDDRVADALAIPDQTAELQGHLGRRQLAADTVELIEPSRGPEADRRHVSGLEERARHRRHRAGSLDDRAQR